MRLLINHVDPKPIARLHQHVKIMTRGMNLHPSRVIAYRWRIHATDQGELAVDVLPVRPDFICPHVGRVEVRFCRVKDHAMDRRLFAVLVVLNILVQLTILVHGEHIAVASMLIEWVSVHTIRGLFGCQNENCPRPGFRTWGQCCLSISLCNVLAGELGV